MSDLMYVSRVRSYKTEREDADGMYRVGMSVATSLNGGELFVGSFNPASTKVGKIGFLTSRERFKSSKAAKKAAKRLGKLFPVGTKMPASEFIWGDPDEEWLVENPDARMVVHSVVYVGEFAGKTEVIPEPAKAEEEEIPV